MIPLNKEILNSFKSLKTEQENRVQFELKIPESLSCFSGHFPGQPVLPAVALIDLSHFFITQAFPKIHSAALKSLPYLKIKSNVVPGQLCLIEVVRNSALDYLICWKTENLMVAEVSFLFG